MKPNYNLLTALCLLASVPLGWLFLHRRSAQPAVPVVRFATFQVGLHRDRPGTLLAELQAGDCAPARRLAEIVQRTEPDVLLLCGIDHDEAAAAAAVFAERYLAVGQNGLRGVDFEFRYSGPVNAGLPSGRDLDADGAPGGPGDVLADGAFPGQGGMVLLSRHPILVDRVRTFQTLPWSRMPGALRPAGAYPDPVWAQLRLSSTSHWDVPIGIGPVADARVVHVLCAQPARPGPGAGGDRNGCRNHDEVRFWSDYLTPGRDGWIVDDAGRAGGLPGEASFVLLGDLGIDPVDGDGPKDAIEALLHHARVHDPEPKGPGGAEQALRQFGANVAQRGDPALDTGDLPDEPGKGPGNLRLDYVLVDRALATFACGVFWPPEYEPTARLVGASDRRLVFVDVGAR